jgi:uncharacterized protein (TIGR03790 family)
LNIKSTFRITDLISILILISLDPFPECNALETSEILILSNGLAAESRNLAEYYMKRRDVPAGNHLTLQVADRETVTREDYDLKIAGPVRKFLRGESGKNIRCLVLMYGMPLRIESPPMSGSEKNELEILEKKKSGLEERLQSAANDEATNATRQELDRAVEAIHSFDRNHDRVASVDSELALVRNEGYPLEMWVPNPFFPGFTETKGSVPRNDVLMVGRLDGPDAATVKRIIEDSIAAEEKGLRGRAYFDARWPESGGENGSAYELYDRSIHLAAKAVAKKNIMTVVTDDGEKLFQKGDCPEAALYCGWYSLGRYVDAFQWQAGSVGYHIASSECTTLKQPGSTVWCKRMLEEGVAATIGPVSEPYVQGFPLPEVFFTYLTDGRYTLAESYLVALPYLSWKMVLIGDPLYRPFRHYRWPKPRELP